MPTFDGDTLTITLDSGVTSVDVVQNLYEPWKDWMLASPLNRKYPQALRSDGGNPLSAIINQGSYIFLNNTAGWRIKPPEEDITIYFTGNLAVEDTALPALIPTTGAFTAAILGLQPVTQGVTEQMAAQLETTSFPDGVAVDVVNGLPGTGYGPDGNPIGSHAAPSDNMVDALAIAQARGLETFIVHGSLTLTTGDDVSGYSLKGENAIETYLTIESGAVVSGCQFSDMVITNSAFDGYTYLNHCSVANITGFYGYMENCLLSYSIELTNGDNTYLVDCKSGCYGVGVEVPVLSFNGLETHLAIRNWSGPVKFSNSSNIASTACVDIGSGATVIIDATVTGGEYIVRGSGKILHVQTGAENIVDETTESQVWAEAIEGTFTAEEVMRIMSSALAGKASGLDSSSPVFRDINDTKNRISATTDANGNRTAVTLVGS